MQKSATLNLRVDPEVKQSAESVLSRLGLSMSTAIDLFLRQVVLTGGIPFRVVLPEAPATVDADAMTDQELVERLRVRLLQVEAGEGMSVEDALASLVAL